MDFSDFKFNPHNLPNRWRAVHTFSNGYVISIICGDGTYSSPQAWMEDPMEYEAYEVAIFDQNGNFKNIHSHDEVAAYQSKEDVMQLIERFIEK